MKRFIILNSLIIATTLIVGYLFAKEASDVYTLYRENEKTKDKIEGLKASNEKLEKRIELLKKDDQYIEKVAREELGMIKMNEKIYRFEE